MSKDNVFLSDLLRAGGGHFLKSTDIPEMLSTTSFAKALVHLQSVFVYGGTSKEVQVYDVRNTKWSTLPRPPHYRSGAAIIGNQFTLIGGRDTRGTPTNDLATWTGKEWKVLYPPMHTARYFPGVLAFGDLVIVSGGEGADFRVDTIEFLDVNKRIWIQSNMKLPRPLFNHHMALCGEYIYIYHWDGYFCRMNKKNFMASLTTNDVHDWEQLENALVKSSLLQYSPLPVLVGPKGIFIFEKKKWTRISEETSYYYNCTASLNGTTFLTFGGRELLGRLDQTRAVQYDIAVKDPKWYQEAIEGHGSIEVNISRAILTGGSRVGKTSLKHYLLHNTAREDKSSTGVLEAPEVATIAGDGVGTTDQRLEVGQGEVEECSFTKGVATGSLWKVMDDEEMGQFISCAGMKVKESFPIIATSKQKATATKVGSPSKPSEDLTVTQQPEGLLGRIWKRVKKLFQRRPANETTEQSVANPLQPPSTQDPPSNNSLQQHEDPLELLEQARMSFLQKHKLSTEAQLDEKQCTFIYLLDTGGQPSFQNVLPLLLDFPCTFVHVFKASKRLTDPYVNAFCQDGATEEKRANSRSTWELMKESITAAYTMSMKSKRQLEAFDMSNEPHFRIFLVGSHLSHLPEDPEAKRALLDHNKKVLEEMNNKPYDGNRVFPPKEVTYKGASSYFLVDSQLQGDSNLKDHTHKAINALRSQLSDANFQLTLKVPKVWFCLQLITSSVKKKMWKLTELKEFCIQCNYIQPVDAHGQLLALLKLFHCLGFYVYFDLGEYKEQWICTDATFLYKEMSKVLSVQYGPENESLAPELRIFKEKGVIPEAVSEALFQQLGIDADIPTRWLLEVLVHVGIAAKVVEETKMHFFIPTVLPERNISLPTESVATLGFAFSFHSVQYQRYSCVPTGLFHRLAVDMASSRQVHKVKKVSRAYIGGNQWRFCPSQSDSTQFIFSQENAHIVLSHKEDLIQLQLLVPKHFSTLAPSLTELCKHIREEMEERIRYVSKRVFGAEFLEEKATLEVGVICHHQNCRTSSLHLLRFEGDNQRTGLCTRLNKMTGLTPRESVWVAKEQDSNTSSLCLPGTFEFDGYQFLVLKDQSLSNGLSSNPNSTDPKGCDISTDSRGYPSSGLRDPESVENWNQTLQTKYWTYLLSNLKVKEIVDELYQGVEGVPLITHQVYDEIRNAKSNKEANTIFMRHLLTAGTVKHFWLFCKVLHQTSDDYGVHEEILEKLKEDFNISF